MATQFEIFLQYVFDHIKLRCYGVEIKTLIKNNLFFYEYPVTVMQGNEKADKASNEIVNTVTKILIIHIYADIKTQINNICLLE